MDGLGYDNVYMNSSCLFVRLKGAIGGYGVTKLVMHLSYFSWFYTVLDRVWSSKEKANKASMAPLCNMHG